MTDNAAAPEKKYISFKAISVVFCLLISLYSGYWFFIATSTNKIISEWQKNSERRGGMMSYDSVTFSGFPLSASVNVKNLKLEQEDKTGWAIPEFTVTVSPFNPKNITLTASDGNVFTSGTSSKVPFAMKFGNTVASTVSSQNNSRDFAFSAEKIYFEAAPSAQSENPGIKNIELNYFGFNITFSPEISQTDSFDTAILNWQKSGGVMKVNDFTLKQQGIDIVIKGEATVSQSMQPMFEGNISVTGAPALLAQLENRNMLPSSVSVIIENFISSLNGGKPVADNQPVIAPIKTSAGGIVSVGPFPMFTIPVISADSQNKTEDEEADENP